MQDKIVSELFRASAFACCAAFAVFLVYCGASSAGAQEPAAIAGNHPDAALELASSVDAAASKTLRIEIILKPRNSGQLAQLLQDQQDPGSLRYHQWLSSSEYDQRFGPTQDEIERITQWLQDSGFTHISADPRTFSIKFEATVGGAQAAFGVHIKASADGRWFANLEDPAVPAALASAIQYIGGLDNLGAMVPAGVGKSRVGGMIPATIITTSGDSNPHFGPIDMSNFYDSTSLLNSGLDGTGAPCIAAIEGTDVDDASLAAFNTTFNLPAFDSSNLTRVYVDSASSTPTGGSPYIEALLDLEWAHGGAPKAPIRFYIGNYADLGNQGLVDALGQAVSDNQCGTISISFGTCGEPASYFKALDSSYFQKAAAQGETVGVASGDFGAAWPGKFSAREGGCFAPRAPDVNETAASPNVTAVGATQFTAKYDSSGVDSGSVPEQVWDSCFTIPISKKKHETICLGASGGGRSQVFPKPKYQAGATPNDGRRDIPDISFGGSPFGNPGFFLAYDESVYQSGGTPGANVYCCVGGTSLDAPYAMTVVTLIEEKAGDRQGNINTQLYAIAKANKKNLAAVGIRDVTAGTNTFTVGVGKGSYTVRGFKAVKGYDRASGWGTLDIANFIPAFLAP